MPDILTPRCPLCDQPPAIVIPGGIQAFCGNEDCDLWCWNPAVSLDDNLLNAGVAKFSQPEEGRGD